MIRSSFFFSFLIFLFFQGCATVYNNNKQTKATGQEKLSLTYADVDTSSQLHEAEIAAAETFKDLDNFQQDHSMKSGSASSSDRFQNIINQYKRSKE